MIGYYNEYGSYLTPPRPDEKQLALYKIALKTTDPKKLSAMMPNWLKKHITDRTIKPLPEFIPGKPPVLPLYTTPRLGIQRDFPGCPDNPAEYIKLFGELNHYKGAN